MKKDVRWRELFAYAILSAESFFKAQCAAVHRSVWMEMYVPVLRSDCDVDNACTCVFPYMSMIACSQKHVLKGVGCDWIRAHFKQGSFALNYYLVF